MKIFLLLLSLSFYLLGSDSSKKEILIHDALAKALFVSTKINVYTDSPLLYENISKYSNQLTLTNEKEATYIIKGSNGNIENKNALLLVTSYGFLKEYTSAIGAFYWKKGRPTIIFIKERLDKKGIVLPKRLHKYYENEKCLYELCF